MKAKFQVVKKVVDLEHPKNNRKKEFELTLDPEDTFGEYNGTYVFKLLSATSRTANLEYNRNFAVKNELKGYEYNTKFILNETKQITSMWGKEQITYNITYLGCEEKTLEEAINDNPAEKYTDDSNDYKKNKEDNKTLDDVVEDQNKFQGNW
jgi:hypothetical protein